MVKEYVIDLFCGFGGTTTGIHLADCDSTVVACVNHWGFAIDIHKKNHPEAFHFVEDVRNLIVIETLRKMVEKIREENPLAVITVWASLECTNFSKAKGGLPRDADSRTLALTMYKYIEAINPDYLMIENVEEFMSWGPLDEKGKPISKDKGIDYVNWVETIESYGYNYEYKILNAADYGAVQSRKRYFGIAAKYGLPITFPKQTHSKSGKHGLKKWRAVREILQLDDYGGSIFTRKKPYVDKTYRRILNGLKKAIAREEQAYLSCYYGTGDNDHSINGPAPTVPTKDRIALVQYMALSYSGGGQYRSIYDPAGTVVVNDKHNFVSAHFIYNPQFGNTGSSVDVPMPTVIARQDKKPLGLISYAFDSRYSIPVYDCDSEVVVELKEFMALHGISDIYMRLLHVEELLLAQGFPADYWVMGTKQDIKKGIGNAVECTIASRMFEAHSKEIQELRNFNTLTLRGWLNQPLQIA